MNRQIIVCASLVAFFLMVLGGLRILTNQYEKLRDPLMKRKESPVRAR